MNLSKEQIIALVTAMAAGAVNIKPILNFFTDRQKVKITKLEEAIECEVMDEITQKHLKEQLANEHYYRASGMRIEKEFRASLIEEHQKCNGELRFFHFK